MYTCVYIDFSAYFIFKIQLSGPRLVLVAKGLVLERGGHGVGRNATVLSGLKVSQGRRSFSKFKL